MNETKLRCSQCGQLLEEEKACFIDNACICVKCIYGDIKPLPIYPIGFINNDLRGGHADFGTIDDRSVSKIELIPSQKPFMYKLEEEKYITVVYYLHRARPVRSVFRRGLDGKEVGVFASRTPDRLSKIGIQDVRLIQIEDTTLYVEGLDAIDGSPVLDIKMRWNRI